MSQNDVTFKSKIEHWLHNKPLTAIPIMIITAVGIILGILVSIKTLLTHTDSKQSNILTEIHYETQSTPLPSSSKNDSLHTSDKTRNFIRIQKEKEFHKVTRIEVKGNITNDSNEPLDSVTVSANGTPTVSNVNGYFEVVLTQPQNTGKMIIFFSYRKAGYEIGTDRETINLDNKESVTHSTIATLYKLK